VASGDALGGRNAAHSLKGASANVGMKPLSLCDAEIEAWGLRSGTEDEGRELFAALQGVWTRSCESLRRYVERSSTAAE